MIWLTPEDAAYLIEAGAEQSVNVGINMACMRNSPCVPFLQPIQEGPMPRSMELDLIGALAGTDKSSLGNRYLQSYEILLSDLRDEEFTLCEIGVFNGASLRMWKSYFSKATILGIDVSAKCKVHEEDRIVVEIGSQADAQFLDDIMGRYDPLVVIDDGSHLADHIQFSFETIFPKLRPGGIYIVEDLYMHFGGTAKKHRAEAKTGMADYFSRLAVDKMRNSPDASERTPFSALVCQSAEFITFGGAFVAVRKKSQPFTAAEIEPLVEQYCSNSCDAQHLLAGAGLMLRHCSAPDKARLLAERAVEMDPMRHQAHRVLAECLLALNRPGEAAVCARRGAELAPNEAAGWHRLASCQFEAGDLPAAKGSIGRAIQLHPLGEHLWMLQSQIEQRSGDMAAALRSAEQAAGLALGTQNSRSYAERASRLAAELTEGAVSSPQVRPGASCVPDRGRA
jgi:hypothetical protein